MTNTNHEKQALIELRRMLMGNPEIHKVIQDNKHQVSARDFWISSAAFLSGLLLQMWDHHSPVIILFALCLQVIGLSGFSSLSHESWHGRALQNKRLNDLLARWFLSPLLLRPFYKGRLSHRTHHQYFGSDSDVDTPVWLQSRSAFLWQQLSYILVIPAMFRAVMSIITGQRQGRKDDFIKANQKENIITLMMILIWHGLWSIIVLHISLWLWLSAYCLPLLLGAFMANLREYGEHRFRADGLFIVYDTDCHWLERLFISGGYFNYHACHHLFPEVPQRQLPKVYRALQKHVGQACYQDSPCIQHQKSYLTLLSRGEHDLHEQYQ